MTRNDDEGNEDLRVLARLLAVALVQGKTQVEAIRLLAWTGMDRNEIARVCGTSADTVSVRLAEAKRKAPKAGAGVKKR